MSEREGVGEGGDGCKSIQMGVQWQVSSDGRWRAYYDQIDGRDLISDLKSVLQTLHPSLHLSGLKD